MTKDITICVGTIGSGVFWSPDGGNQWSQSPLDMHVICCPLCASSNTEQVCENGACKCQALYRCRSCGEPFDRAKDIYATDSRVASLQLRATHERGGP